VHAAPSVRRIVWQRVTAVAAVGCSALLLMGVLAGSAGAAPPPTLSQVRATLSKLQTQADQLGQQYDQVQQQLASTNQRLGVIDKQAAAYSLDFAAERKLIGEIAVTRYEDGNLNSSIALLASGNPQQVLNQSSILLELSATDNAQIGKFLADARQLNTTEILVQRTKAGIEQLDSTLHTQKESMDKLVSQEQTLLAQLTPAEQAGVAPGSGGSSAPVQYTGPTGTQADAAVAFAYSKVGCPYVYGGTGPCSSGYDCSGLTQAAWAAAGISIPRTSYEQWDSLPHVAMSDLQPGDILVFNGAGHVAIYVGNNELIDAPHTGLDVELASLTGWYVSTLDGAVRP
jgi:peptidoglycan DL-endopeptidase CwlO